MRRASFVVLLAGLVGCGSGKPPAESGGGGGRALATSPSVKAAAMDAKPAGAEKITPPSIDKSDPVKAGYHITVIEDYSKNHIAADAKYRDKWCVVDVGVKKISRGKDGLPLFATDNFSWDAEPNIVFHFAADQEEAVAKVDRKRSIRVEGKCVGRTDDGIRRGAGGGRIPDYEFRVDFVECRVVGPTPAK